MIVVESVIEFSWHFVHFQHLCHTETWLPIFDVFLKLGQKGERLVAIYKLIEQTPKDPSIAF